MTRQLKRTGGGTFDPAARPIYFAAGDATHYPHYVLQAVNDLWTPGLERRLPELLDAGHQVLLDSGIFWLTNRHARDRGVSMDEALRLAPEDIDGFEELHGKYLTLVNRYADRLWGYIELDQGGRENKKRTRAGLEAAGLAPTPVYHPLVDGWDYFDELAQQYDRICFGNIVQAPRPVRLRLLHTLWERHRTYPNLWVHILGLTASEWCLALPTDSCDSSSWVAPVRWPKTTTESALLKPVGTIGRGFAYDYDAPGNAPRGRHSSFALCAEAVASRQRLWDHATVRLADLTTPEPYPARTEQENHLR